MSLSDPKFVDSQLYEQMDGQETEALLAMWCEHDQEAWTDEAFAAMHAVLLKRLGSVPEQGRLSMRQEESDMGELDMDESNIEEEDTLPDSRTLRLLAIWANRLAWAVVGMAVLMFLLGIAESADALFSGFPGQNLLLNRLHLWVSYLYSLSIGAAYFILLKAVSAGAYFLSGRDEK